MPDALSRWFHEILGNRRTLRTRHCRETKFRGGDYLASQSPSRLVLVGSKRAIAIFASGDEGGALSRRCCHRLLAHGSLPALWHISAALQYIPLRFDVRGQADREMYRLPSSP